MMSIYLSRSFPRSNSSFFLCSGNALQSEVLRLREEMFLVNAGLGTPRICMQDELTGVPINRATRFTNKVGFLAGESLIKERAATWFKDLVGSTDVVAGEPLLLLPRKFRQNRAWMELNKIWRTKKKKKVKGFILKKKVKVKGLKRKRGYLVQVAIAGFITFCRRNKIRKKILNDRFTFTIKSIKSKRTKIVLKSGRSNIDERCFQEAKRPLYDYKAN